MLSAWNMDSTHLEPQEAEGRPYRAVGASAKGRFCKEVEDTLDFCFVIVVFNNGSK